LSEKAGNGHSAPNEDYFTRGIRAVIKVK
jgi:hypothetical protein